MRVTHSNCIAALCTFFLYSSLQASEHWNSLSNSDINRFVAAIPLTANQLDSIVKMIDTDDAKRKKLAKAGLDGEKYRTMLSLGRGDLELDALAAKVKAAGFESLNEWALVGDRISSVLFVGSWVASVSRMKIPGAVQDNGIPKDTDVFSYIENLEVDEIEHQKYEVQLEEMCQKSCVFQDDLEVVGARYSELRSVFSNYN